MYFSHGILKNFWVKSENNLRIHLYKIHLGLFPLLLETLYSPFRFLKIPLSKCKYCFVKLYLDCALSLLNNLFLLSTQDASDCSVPFQCVCSFNPHIYMMYALSLFFFSFTDVETIFEFPPLRVIQLVSGGGRI